MFSLLLLYIFFSFAFGAYVADQASKEIHRAYKSFRKTIIFFILTTIVVAVTWPVLLADHLINKK